MLLPPKPPAEATEPASTKSPPTKATTTEAITAKQTAAPKPVEAIEAAVPTAQTSEAGVTAAEAAP